MQTVESRPEIIVPLATKLFRSESEQLNFEHQIEADLNRIFDEQWGPGWDYDPYEQSIDVWSAADSPEHVEALIGLGFSLVRIHAHARAEPCRGCTPHWSAQ